MLNMLAYLDSIFSILVATLVLFQTVINFWLPPEKAEKFNYIGKTLDFLAKTKGGMSLRIENGNSRDISKCNNTNSTNS